MEQKNFQNAEFGLGTVEAGGLFFNGRLYSNAEMIRQQWFVKAALNGSWIVPILHFESEPEQIIIMELKGVELAFIIEKARTPRNEIEQAYFEAINNLKEQLELQKAWFRDRS